jgi:hypothetical protein
VSLERARHDDRVAFPSAKFYFARRLGVVGGSGAT